MSQSLRSTNRLSANIDESTIISVIREKFDLSSDSTIELVSIEVDEEEQKIRIYLQITTTERPAKVAERYFGLTNKVREELGAAWSGFFPVITPQIQSEMHV